MKTKGFTLIELLVVISVISLMSTIVLGSLNDARDKGRIAAGQKFGASLHHAIGDELVGEWKFDDSDTLGTAHETSGNKFNGVIHNAIYSSNGMFDNAMKFDGDDDYVEITSDSRLTPESITIEMWAHQDVREPEWTYLLEKAGFSSYNLISEDTHAINHIGFTVVVGGNSYRLWGNQGLKIEKWSHVAFTYNSDTGEQRTYFDGKLDTVSANVSGAIDTAAGSLRISGSGVKSFNGSIDNVRIYSKVLTSAQIQKYYAEGLKDHQTLASN